MLSLQHIEKLVEYTRVLGLRAKSLRSDGLKIEIKNDGSKVTNADKELDLMLIEFIRNELQNNDLIISEEDVGSGNTPMAKNNESYWSIDPIDGTNAFIKGHPYWTVNIAYIENGVPIFGLINAPDLDAVWYGSIEHGAFKKIADNAPVKISVRKVPKEGAILMSSELQITPCELREELNVIKEIKIPSSVKFTYIAEGKADYYTRKRNKACEWDISSGHGLILAAGGTFEFTDSSEAFKYGVPPYMAPALLAKGKC